MRCRRSASTVASAPAWIDVRAIGARRGERINHHRGQVAQLEHVRLQTLQEHLSDVSPSLWQISNCRGALCARAKLSQAPIELILSSCKIAIGMSTEQSHLLDSRREIPSLFPRIALPTVSLAESRMGTQKPVRSFVAKQLAKGKSQAVTRMRDTSTTAMRDTSTSHSSPHNHPSAHANRTPAAISRQAKRHDENKLYRHITRTGEQVAVRITSS
eukprot:1771742-Pleurochrysis_carterae.AAC.4